MLKASVGIAVSLCITLLYLWYLQPVGLRRSAAALLAVPCLTIAYDLLILIYKPVFYYENYLLWIAAMAVVAHTAAALSVGKSFQVALLFGIGSRISIQLVLYPLAVAIPGFAAQVVDVRPLVQLGIESLAMVLRALMAALLRRRIRNFTDSSPDRFAVLLILIPLVSSVVINILVMPYIDANYIFPANSRSIAYLLLAALSYLMLILSVYALSEQKKRMEMEKLQAVVQAQHDFYQRKADVDQAVQNMYHDMKNHLSCIRHMSDSADIAAYIDSIHAEIASFGSYVNTGSPFLDAVINEKHRLAEQKQIQFLTVIDYPKDSPLRSHDICTIFGNLLDNALEAAEKVADPARRCVTLKVFGIDGFLMIHVNNSMSEAPTCEGGRYRTTKTGTGHGIGLRSVDMCLQRYHGILKTEISEGMFQTGVMIPKP